MPLKSTFERMKKRYSNSNDYIYLNHLARNYAHRQITDLWKDVLKKHKLNKDINENDIDVLLEAVLKNANVNEGRPEKSVGREGIDYYNKLGYVPYDVGTVSYTHLRAHETPEHLVCRLLLEKTNQYHYI